MEGGGIELCWGAGRHVAAVSLRLPAAVVKQLVAAEASGQRLAFGVAERAGQVVASLAAGDASHAFVGHATPNQAALYLSEVEDVRSYLVAPLSHKLHAQKDLASSNIGSRLRASQQAAAQQRQRGRTQLLDHPVQLAAAGSGGARPGYRSVTPPAVSRPQPAPKPRPLTPPPNLGRPSASQAVGRSSAGPQQRLVGRSGTPPVAGSARAGTPPVQRPAQPQRSGGPQRAPAARDPPKPRSLQAAGSGKQQAARKTPPLGTGAKPTGHGSGAGAGKPGAARGPSPAPRTQPAAAHKSPQTAAGRTPPASAAGAAAAAAKQQPKAAAAAGAGRPSKLRRLADVHSTGSLSPSPLPAAAPAGRAVHAQQPLPQQPQQQQALGQRRGASQQRRASPADSAGSGSPAPQQQPSKQWFASSEEDSAATGTSTDSEPVSSAAAGAASTAPSRSAIAGRTRKRSCKAAQLGPAAAAAAEQHASALRSWRDMAAAKRQKRAAADAQLPPRHTPPVHVQQQQQQQQQQQAAAPQQPASRRTPSGGPLDLGPPGYEAFVSAAPGPHPCVLLGSEAQYAAACQQYESLYALYFALHRLLQSSASSVRAAQTALRAEEAGSLGAASKEAALRQMLASRGGLAARWDAAFRNLHAELLALKQALAIWHFGAGSGGGGGGTAGPPAVAPLASVAPAAGGGSGGKGLMLRAAAVC